MNACRKGYQEIIYLVRGVWLDLEFDRYFKYRTVILKLTIIEQSGSQTSTPTHTSQTKSKAKRKSDVLTCTIKCDTPSRKQKRAQYKANRNRSSNFQSTSKYSSPHRRPHLGRNRPYNGHHYNHSITPIANTRHMVSITQDIPTRRPILYPIYTRYIPQHRHMRHQHRKVTKQCHWKMRFRN